MDYNQLRKRLEAAEKLLSEESTTRAKFEAARALIKDIDSRLDCTLADCSKALSTVEKIEKKKVIDLAAEALPEDTPQRKKRKKALLLFLGHWRQLQGEVKRVRGELQPESQQAPANQSQIISGLGRILALAKGPLGLITLVAIGIVLLENISATVKIKNQGCPTLYPTVSIPIPIPGLKLPKEPIAAGQEAEAKLPPLTVKVANQADQNIILQALNFQLQFQLSPETEDLLFDGRSLLGKETTVSFKKGATHEVIVRCQK